MKELHFLKNNSQIKEVIKFEIRQYSKIKNDTTTYQNLRDLARVIFGNFHIHKFFGGEKGVPVSRQNEVDSLLPLTPAKYS